MPGAVVELACAAPDLARMGGAFARGRPRGGAFHGGVFATGHATRVADGLAEGGHAALACGTAGLRNGPGLGGCRSSCELADAVAGGGRLVRRAHPLVSMGRWGADVQQGARDRAAAPFFSAAWRGLDGHCVAGAHPKPPPADIAVVLCSAKTARGCMGQFGGRVFGAAQLGLDVASPGVVESAAGDADGGVDLGLHRQPGLDRAGHRFTSSHSPSGGSAGGFAGRRHGQPGAGCVG